MKREFIDIKRGSLAQHQYNGCLDGCPYSMIFFIESEMFPLKQSYLQLNMVEGEKKGLLN